MSNFRFNPSFLQELRRDPQLRKAVLVQAEVAKRHAASMARTAGAPWMRRKGHATIEIQVTAEGIRVVNTDHGGHLMEWGSSRNPPHAPLRRGARAAGLHLRDSGKN